MTSINNNEVAAEKQLIADLTGAMREASAAIACRDLPALEEAVRRQQQIVTALQPSGRCSQGLTTLDPSLLAGFMREQSLLVQILHSSSITVRALLSVLQPDPVYSFDSLPRR